MLVKLLPREQWMDLPLLQGLELESSLSHPHLLRLQHCFLAGAHLALITEPASCSLRQHAEYALELATILACPLGLAEADSGISHFNGSSAVSPLTNLMMKCFDLGAALWEPGQPYSIVNDSHLAGSRLPDQCHGSTAFHARVANVLPSQCLSRSGGCSKQGAMSEQEARRYFQQLILALDYSQRMGITSRYTIPHGYSDLLVTAMLQLPCMSQAVHGLVFFHWFSVVTCRPR